MTAILRVEDTKKNEVFSFFFVFINIRLNKLNERTEYCLIETDARESIFEIIQNGAIDCGLQDYDGDITEEWREW